MRMALLAAGALLALAAPALADEPAARIAPSWDEGLAEARRRNIPVLVILQKDGAQPFVKHLQQPAFAQFLDDRAVVIVGHRPGGHQPAKRVDRREGREVEYCPLYLSIPCSVHDAIYNDDSGRFDYAELPAAFICRPDGRASLSGVERMAPPAIMTKIDEAQAALGEGTFRSEAERLERKLQKGDEKLAEGKLGAARKATRRSSRAPASRSCAPPARSASRGSTPARSSSSRRPARARARPGATPCTGSSARCAAGRRGSARPRCCASSRASSGPPAPRGARPGSARDA